MIHLGNVVISPQKSSTINCLELVSLLLEHRESFQPPTGEGHEQINYPWVSLNGNKGTERKPLVTCGCNELDVPVSHVESVKRG